MKLVALSVFLLYFCLYNESSATPYGADNKLTSVVVMYRHGDRTVKESYPKDPFFDKSYWPEGYSSFTTKGRIRHYNLGTWFRERYATFLSDRYKKTEMKVYSADTDNCLMSAECNLAGLYKVKPADQWVGGLPWEPVPIHTRPDAEDSIVAMEAPCAKYSKLYEEVKKSKPFTDITTANADMFKFISEKTGWTVNDIDYIRGLYQVFYIYDSYNSSFIPSWAADLNRTKVTELAGQAWARETYNADLKRLKAGPMFNALFNYFDQIIAGQSVAKFTMIASSIRALTAVLNTMDVFDNHPIEFAATIIWELSKNAKGSNILNMYYRKSYAPELQPLKLKGCPDFDCDYKIVKNLLNGFAIDKDSWEKECKV